MGVYITTSKNPSTKTKVLCEALSSVLPGSAHERRGKKSIEQIFRRAKLLGKGRVMLIYEKSSAPCKMCFMNVKAHSWDWVGEEILVSNFRIYRLPKELPNELMIAGGRKEEFERLLDFEKPEGDDFIELNCGKKKLSFTYGGKPLLKLEMVS
jgi:rRNA maturation protein Rpf1